MIGTRGGLIIALFAVLSMGLKGTAQTGNWKAAAALPAAKESNQRILADVQQRAGNSLTIRYRVPEAVIGEVRQGENGERVVDVDMTLTAPGCGMGDILVEMRIFFRRSGPLEHRAVIIKHQSILVCIGREKLPEFILNFS